MAKKSKKTKEIQDDLKESVHKIWLAGLGALATAEEEGSKVFKNLVARGENYETKGRKAFEDAKGKVEGAADDAREKATSSFEKIGTTVDDTVARVLQKTGVPTREEIALLTRRVEELTKVVEGLREADKPAAKPTAKRTTRAKTAAKAKTTAKKPAAKTTTSDAN